MPTFLARAALILALCSRFYEGAHACRPLPGAGSPGACARFKRLQGLPVTTAGSAASFPAAGVVLPIRWTVALPAGQTVTAAVLGEQLAVLNQRFAPVRIQFRTQSIVRKTYSGDCFYDADRVGALAGGSAAVLSVVICPGSDTLGMAFPSTNEAFSFANMVFINPVGLPGAAGVYNLGLTLVHELGHTFGLDHVFDEDGKRCFDADGIVDTPFQATPTGGCPARKDSCPGNPGLDSVNNYMDYSDDRCLTSFTPNQIAFMRNFAANYKRTLMSQSSSSSTPKPSPPPARAPPRPKPRPPPPRRPPPRPWAKPGSLKTHGMKLSVSVPGCSAFLESGYDCTDRWLYLGGGGDESAVWDVVGGDWVGSVAGPVMVYSRYRFRNLEDACTNDLVFRQASASVGRAATSTWRVSYTAPNTVRLQSAATPSTCLGFSKAALSRDCYDANGPFMVACSSTTAVVDWKVSFVADSARCKTPS